MFKGNSSISIKGNFVKFYLLKIPGDEKDVILLHYTCRIFQASFVGF